MKKKINTYTLIKISLYLCIAIAIGFCCLYILENKDLEETSFSYHQTKYQRYETNIPLTSKFEGKIIHLSNYQEYQSLLNQYDIINNQELTENDFIDNNYLYVIVGEPACVDDFQYVGYFESNKEITLKFTYTNCACPLSSIRARAYEILIPKSLTKKEKYNISFIQDNSNDICTSRIINE